MCCVIRIFEKPVAYLCRVDGDDDTQHELN